VRYLSVFPLSHYLIAFAGGIAVLGLPFAYPWHRWEIAALLLSTGASSGLGLWLYTGRSVGKAAAVVSTALLVGCVICGYGYGSWRLGTGLDRRIPDCADASLRQFFVTLIDQPEIETDQRTGLVNARFRGNVSVAPEDPACPLLGRYGVRLTWYGAPDLNPGERWQVEGKLRPPWGYRNPGGFDYQRWLLGERLDGTGYIRSGNLVARPDLGSGPIGGLRNRLSDWIETQHVRHGGLVLALMVGDDSAITREQWDWLRDSGTIHLVVVSGLHVGMIAGCLFVLGRLGARCCPWALVRFGSHRIAGVVAIAGSGFYVVLAGAGIPAVRAWLMSAALLTAMGSGRALSANLLLGAIGFMVLVHDPLAVHQQGFWLSFVAVSALIGFFVPRGPAGNPPGSSRIRALSGKVGLLLQTQLVLLVALSPLLAVTQGVVPLLGPFANLLVVPLVTLALLPLVLLVGLFALWLPEVAAVLLGIVDQGLELVMQIVSRASSVEPWAAGIGAWPEAGLLTVCVVLLLQSPGRIWAIPLSALWFAMLLVDIDTPGYGGFRLLAMDVGQGSSILIETRHHTLLYDTGPGFPSGFNLGEAVVVPTYLKRHATPLDGLILSHDDVDHTGGAAVVLRELQPVRIWSSFELNDPIANDPFANDPFAASRCKAGEHWNWDGVEFRFLGPVREWRDDNDRSCVLLIEAQGRQALIAGDISSRVERQLTIGKVDLLFAPHHGSRTSSSLKLIRAAEPDVVFISTTRRSRYGHPHQEVIDRYRDIDADIYVTGWDGALTWTSTDPDRVLRWRRDESAYWHLRNHSGE